MKSNKEQVYEFIKSHFSAGSEQGLTTQYLSKAIGIQRTNMSSILNTLTADGLIKKTVGRPVRYFLAQKPEDLQEFMCFTNMVGFNGSLRRVVQLAKAAILYPQQSLDTLIIGARGTGKSFLATLMHQFAIERGILKPNAELRVFDGNYYQNREDAAIGELFGNNGGQNLFEALRGGILLIDNAQLLPARVRSLICGMLERGGPMVILVCNDDEKNAVADFQSKLPIVIELPPLGERPLTERMELISKQFAMEAVRAKRTLAINAEVLRCLLLYDCTYNINQLKLDIKVGCANAYVRGYRKKGDRLDVYIGDFEHYVRDGFAHYKEFRKEAEEIIPSDYGYLFSGSSMEMTPIERSRLEGRSIYDYMEERARNLAENGLPEKDIELILDAEVESSFFRYQNEIQKQAVNKSQLSKLVSERVIELVDEFLAEASTILQKDYSSSVFHGLCLHIDSILKRRHLQMRLSERQVVAIAQGHNMEYTLSLRFVEKLRHEYMVDFPIDEAVLITMFLCYNVSAERNTRNPVMLFMFRGDDLAKAFVKSIEAITKNDNVFYFDIPFKKEPEELYPELCEHIKKINRGGGVLAFCDSTISESFLDSISSETGIPIRQIPFPIVLAMAESSYIVAAHDNIDAARSQMLTVLRAYMPLNKKVIVTLCSTGDGGAQRLKEYITRYGEIEDTEVIALGAADREELTKQLRNLLKTRSIHCIVGVYDPKLFSIPFISISDIFSARPEELPNILQFKHEEKRKIDFDEVFEYLSQQLERVDIRKLRRILPVVVEEINNEVIPMSLDTEIGLFVHIACCINRVLGMEHPQSNLKKEYLIGKYKEHYKKLLRALKPLERTFGVVFSDDEMANIITIINKL